MKKIEMPKESESHGWMLSRQRVGVLQSWLPTIISWEILKGAYDWTTPSRDGNLIGPI